MSGSLYKMSQLCDITSSKRIHASDYRSEGVPFYRGKEITEKFKGNIDVTTEIFIERELFEKIRNKFGAPTAGDLLLTSVGTLGSPYVVKQDDEFYFKDGNLTWFRNFNNLDSKYLFYWLQSPHGNAQLKRATIGSSQPAYTIVLLKEMEISLPPLPTQRKIAAILSAYDDLIENNVRRIKILEEMAQNLYREWFVKFRFPGHKKAKFVDSPLGRIPEGWELSSLIESCNLIMGQSPKSEFYNTEGIGLPFHQGVTDFGDRYPSERLYCTVEGRTAEKGDILFSVRAPVGRINIANTRMVIGRGLSAIRHKKSFQWFTFNLLKENFKEEDSMGGGTIFKSVTKNDMENIPFILPQESLLQQFEQLAGPLGKQIENLTNINTNLRLTRDLLLPKLISGEVDISELDIHVPEEVA